MTMEQLQILHAILQHRTFSEAANVLHLSQSVLSKQIAKLEKELDVLIFDRSKRIVSLTPQGEIVANHAVEMLQVYDHLKDDLNQKDTLSQTTINIAMLPVLSQYNFVKRLAQFQQLYPNITLSVKEMEERDFHHEMRLSDFDIFILRDGSFLKGYRSSIMYQDVLCAVMAKKHPLAHHKSIHMEDLKTQSLLVLPAYTAITSIAKQACVKAGFKPNITRHGRLETILAAARENEGIALVMENALHMFHLADMHVASLIEPIHGDIQIFHHPSHEKKESVRAFLSFFDAHECNHK